MNDVPVTIFWFRRDLRLFDNKGLYFALRDSDVVLPLFIFDENIIEHLSEDDERILFIYQVLADINKQLKKQGKSGVVIKKGKPADVFRELVDQYSIKAVYFNKDHEPYGESRDEEVGRILEGKDIHFKPYLDHLIMDKYDVLKDEGQPYQIFTPYSRKWKSVLNEKHLQFFDSAGLTNRFYDKEIAEFPSIEQLGFKSKATIFPPADIPEDIISNYHNTRDFPAIDGTTRLGPHLRFGTISIRELVNTALKLNQTFLNELIWREFYAMILWNFPFVAENSFRKKFDHLGWRNNEEEFERWAIGTTGYPMVDAGMRQLVSTGYMHNRLRMITAGFLTKHLLIDWRWGESFFAEKLLDFELSSNNGGWQWSAGTGTDAAPFFRIFNPMEQQKKFDPDMKYIKKWIPEYETEHYPDVIIEHKQARERCLKAYEKIKKL